MTAARPRDTVERYLTLRNLFAFSFASIVAAAAWGVSFAARWAPIPALVADHERRVSTLEETARFLVCVEVAGINDTSPKPCELLLDDPSRFDPRRAVAERARLAAP